MPTHSRDLKAGIEIYWAEIAMRSPDVQQREKAYPLLAACYATRTPPHFVRAEVAEIIAWKHTDSRWRQRAMRGLDAVSEESIRPRTAAIQTLVDPDGAMAAFTSWARGIGPATVSAIVTAARPDRSPEFDLFALEALAARHDAAWLAKVPRDPNGRAIADQRQWAEYVHACRELARQESESSGKLWTPRRIDMALWGLGKLGDARRTLPKADPPSPVMARPVPAVPPPQRRAAEPATPTTPRTNGRQILGRVRNIQPNAK